MCVLIKSDMTFSINYKKPGTKIEMKIVGFHYFNSENVYITAFIKNVYDVMLSRK